jgi:uncharacterized protein YdbL (DUF1318 family)
MKRIIPFKLLILGLLAACVTVNVYFPAAAAEQAADRIIDTVTSQPGGAKSNETNETAPKKTPPNSRLTPRTDGLMRDGIGSDRLASTDLAPANLVHTALAPAALAPANLAPAALAVDGSGRPGLAAHSPATDRPVLLAAAGALLNLLIPAAEAQASPNLDVSDPQIRAVTASMQQRFGDLKKYFDTGVIGLTADGQVTIRDQNAVPLAERAVVARLVAEDNRDRATLYAELARANKHPEWESDIRRTFARRWVERGAQSGWYYQDASGKWLQK